MAYAPKVYRKQGGDELVVASGGTITVESGGTLANAGTQNFTGTLQIGGSSVTSTAAELNELDLSVVGAAMKVKKLTISTTPTGSEQDTTWDLPAKALVLDIWVDVTAAEVTGTTKTLDVGLLSSESGGDADGFIAGLSVASTGVKVPGYARDGGSAYFDTNTKGVLISSFVQGSGTDDRGLYAVKAHSAGSVTAKSVSYTAGDTDWNEFRGSIYILYVEIA